MPKMLSRRTVLKGLLGGAAASVGLPILEAMLNVNGDALADGAALPQRLGIFFWGNGVRLDYWTPSTVGANWTPSVSLQPLAANKDYVNVVSGFTRMTASYWPHHDGSAALLTGQPVLVNNPNPFNCTYAVPSLDQMAAKVIGNTRFRSLQTACSESVDPREGDPGMYLSHNGPNDVNKQLTQPSDLFNQLFGSGPAGIDLAGRKSVLDAVLADGKSLSSQVGSADRARLDQHFTSIRQLEVSLQSSAGCIAPSNPGPLPKVNGKEQIMQRSQAFAQLHALALACDQTRVFLHMNHSPVSDVIFPEVTSMNTSFHDLTHNEAGDQPTVQAAVVYTMQRLNDFLTALRATPDGTGNLLDNMVLLAASELAEGYNHSTADMPVLVIGGGRGKLKTPGIHHRSVGTNLSNIPLTILQTVGVPATSLGMPGDGGYTTQNVPEILK